MHDDALVLEHEQRHHDGGGRGAAAGGGGAAQLLSEPIRGPYQDLADQSDAEMTKNGPQVLRVSAALLTAQITFYFSSLQHS